MSIEKNRILWEFDTAKAQDKINIFNNTILPLLEKQYNVSRIDDLTFKIKDTKYGDIYFYVRGNKCFLWRKGRWVKPGLQWILKNLVKDEK